MVVVVSGDTDRERERELCYLVANRVIISFLLFSFCCADEE